ncbi:siroheme synthase, partial [Novosphingobium sp. 1949]|nr:siroheme synthase [Novosphingobium organovorum]
ALTTGGALDPLREDSAARLEDWIAGADAAQGDGVCEIVLTSLDPDDLTLRQARLIGEADAIACAPGLPETLLVRARADAVRLDLAPGEAPVPVSGLLVVLRAPTRAAV